MNTMPKQNAALMMKTWKKTEEWKVGQGGERAMRSS